MYLNKYAVITGNLVRSSRFKEKRNEALSFLNRVLDELRTRDHKHAEVWVSNIFSGDSFQFVVSDATYALLIATYLRARLIKQSPRGVPLDARISIGIGSIEYFNKDNLTESDGEAFQLSERSIDSMPNYRRLQITTADKETNTILDMISSLLDAIAIRWTKEQAEAISYWIFGETQTDLSRRLGISQSAVQQRLQLAGHFAIENCIENFHILMARISFEANNHHNVSRCGKIDIQIW